MRFKLIGKMVDVDDRLLHAGGDETVEAIVDQRAPADGDKRLRNGF